MGNPLRKDVIFYPAEVAFNLSDFCFGPTIDCLSVIDLLPAGSLVKRVFLMKAISLPSKPNNLRSAHVWHQERESEREREIAYGNEVMIKSVMYVAGVAQ